MSLLTIIVVLVLAGVLLWAIQTFIPMDAKVKLLLQVVVIVILLLWVLQGTGLLGPIESIRVGK